MKESPLTSVEEIVSLCKRRGFIFPSSEIYGGLQGVYDYGPLGVELKNNLKNAWWQSMVYERDDVEGLDSAILTHRLTLAHSGHEETFTDPMVDCRSCNRRFRADHLIEKKCEFCGSADLTEPRPFNLMFRTTIGPIDDGKSFAYLRPETAQGIFTNFKHIVNAMARKLPFGIAQVGKAFRNEVTPKNFLFRVREFEQMELEFFVKPGTDEEWHKEWIASRLAWWKEQGLSQERLKLAPQEGKELAHYAKATTDILYHFPHGFEEIEGIANRADFDLGSHTKEQESFSLKATVKPNTDATTKLSISDLATKEELIPFVIEPSAGLDRGLMAILVDAYSKEEINGKEGRSRIVLKLKPHLAPIKVALVPLAKNNSAIVECAKRLKKSLQTLKLGRIKYEDTGNVGKAYRRHDEIGTPLCVTVDFETLEEKTVTVRYRDSMKQERIAIASLPSFIKDYFM